MSKYKKWVEQQHQKVKGYSAAQPHEKDEPHEIRGPADRKN